jgi:hypothetical protein
MTFAVSFGSALARLFLLPGDLACDAIGLGQADNRDLVRMLVNSLAWTLAGLVIVFILV